MTSWRALVREPLLYFLLVGTGVFLVDARLRREHESVRVSPDVSRDVAARLTSDLARPPTPAELASGIESWLATERLYREAKALGLDENDAIVRDQLARKLRIIVKQRTIVPTATEAELRAAFERNRARYVSAPTFEVTHAFVARAASSEPLEKRAERALSRLAAGDAPETVSDHFPRGPKFPPLPQYQLEEVLGVKLAATLDPKSPGVWRVALGPRGAHLLRLDAYHDGTSDFEAVRDALVRDVEEQKREAAVAAFLAELEEKYPLESALVP